MDWYIDAFEQFDVSLSNVQKQQFEHYERELIDWNTNRFNLTAITEPEQIHNGISMTHYPFCEISR